MAMVKVKAKTKQEAINILYKRSPNGVVRDPKTGFVVYPINNYKIRV